MEHVVAKQHGGPDDPANLALACSVCNAGKGPNVCGFDPDTGEMTRLFDPRRQAWRDHFRLDGARVIGRTAAGRATAGRATADLLAMNLSHRMRLRTASLARAAR